MEKLELKHMQHYPMGINGIKILLPKYEIISELCPPFPLNGVSIGVNKELQLEMLLPNGDIIYTSSDADIEECKPILHALSDLVKEIEINGNKFVPYIELLRECNFDVDNMSIEEIEHFKPDIQNEDVFSRMFLEVEKLFEWHFDVYGLIEKGLAIDINTL